MGGKKLVIVTAAVVAGGAIAVLQAQRPARPRSHVDTAPRVAAVAAAPAPAAPAAPNVAAATAMPAAVAPRTVKRAAPVSQAAESRRPMPLEERVREAKEAATRGAAGQEGGRDRWEQWFYGQRAYPATTLPANARAKAIGQAKTKNKARTATAVVTWTPLGPTTIPAGQTDDAVGPLTAVSGRVAAIAADPNDANVIYVGGAQGGVWKSTDGGVTFAPKTDHQASLSVGDIAIDPVDSNIVYVATGEPNNSGDTYFGAGVLRSTDGGETWTQLGGELGGVFYGMAIAKILVDPATAGGSGTTLWACTINAANSIAGEITPGPWTASSGFGGGLFRSTDSGVTWALQNVPDGIAAPGVRFYDAALDPTDSNTLYVVARNKGIYKSTNAKDPSPTFTLLNELEPLAPTNLPYAAYSLPGIRRHSLAIDATGLTMYTAIAGSDSTLFGVYKSTDAGATWAHLDGGLNGQASVETGGNGTFWLNKTAGPPIGANQIGHRVIILDNGGLRALRVVDVSNNGTRFQVAGATVHDKKVPYSIGNYPRFCEGQCNYDMTIAVDPNDADAVVMGGNPRFDDANDTSGVQHDSLNLGHTMWRSTDGGSSWGSISQGDATTGGIHTDDHDLVFGADGTLYDANDGGAWKSTDRGSSWINLNTNLTITQFSGVSQHPTDKSIVLGGTQDNGSNIRNVAGVTPDAWFHADYGDGGNSIIDTTNPNRMFHTYYNVPNPFALIGPAKVTDGGVNGPGSWQFVGSYGGYGAQYYNGVNPNEPCEFYLPLAQHPAYSPNVIYMATNHLYRSPDPQSPLLGVASWTAVSPDLTHTAGADITAIGVLPYLIGGKEVVYVGTSDGAIQVTSNLDASNTATWSRIDAAPLPGRYVTSIFVDPADPSGNTVYATFSGFQVNTFGGAPGHVFKSSNGLGGTTWTDISGDLPDIPVNAVAVTPAGIIAGTDIGPFLTVDDGATWTLVDDGHPDVAVFAVKYNPSTGQVITATHGRGMFELQSDLCKHGDVNGDGNIDVADVFFYINYLFAGGPAPTCATALYVNGDNQGDVADVFYLINYLFAGGAAPI